MFAERLAVALAMFGLLYSFYLLTYSSVFNSDDERYIIDTTESLVRRGSLYLSQTTYIRPFQTSDVELAQPILAIPLYLVATHLSFAGNVQTVFLFNPLVTALTAVVLYFFALDLGYRRPEALLGGLVFGLATIAWPYTKTFFREPLAALTLLSSFFSLHRWRARLGSSDGLRHTIWLGLGVGAFALSVLSKEAALIAAPAVVVYALPSLGSLRAHRRNLLIMAAVSLATALLLAGGIMFIRSARSAVPYRYDLSGQLGKLLRGLAGAGPGVAGFLLSPGKSLFVYSPAALLAVGALFVRQPESRRERWLAAGMLLLFVVTYAAIRGKLWHGGSGWGPRYMVPLTPFLILGGLPLLRRSFGPARGWLRAGVVLLIVTGVLVQLPGLLVNMHTYYRELEALEPGAPWTVAVWQAQYSQVVGHLRLMNQVPLDSAWLRPEADRLALSALLGGAVFFGSLLARLSRPASLTRRGQARVVIVGSLALAAGLSVFALYRACDDPYFNGDDPVLREMLAYLTEAVPPHDPIVLSNPRYVNLFTNYYKGKSAWYAMPRSPGERHSEEEVPRVVSDNPEDLVSQQAVDLWRYLAGTSGGHPMWLVVDGGPYTPWYPRPPEWWAAERYYTVQSQEFSPTARVVEYLGYAAPKPGTPPAHEHGDRLGEGIVLAGYDLEGYRRADARAFHPGDQLGVSLVWRANEAPTEDYIAAVYLIGPDGQLYLQQDRTPVATFRPTSTWERGETLRDNYGFILAPDLPLGRYEIWVTMYSWPSLERLPAASAGGEEVGDHLVVTAFELVSASAPLD